MEQEGRNMSECVIRMEMPERCCDCDMADGVTCMATGGVYGREVPKMTWIRRRPDWCPIICSLPEGHGRLVDEKSVRWAIDDIVLEIANRTGRVEMTKDETMEYINNLYTIVPAERSET